MVMVNWRLEAQDEMMATTDLESGGEVQTVCIDA